MTRNPLPSLAQSGDDLDGLLRAFFQAQMPRPWPKAPSAASVRPFRARPSRFALVRSRLALAASVALLILSSWWLAGHSEPLASPERPPTIEGASAGTGDRIRHGGRRPQRATPDREMEPVKVPGPMDLPPMK